MMILKVIYRNTKVGRGLGFCWSGQNKWRYFVKTATKLRVLCNFMSLLAGWNPMSFWRNSLTHGV